MTQQLDPNSRPRKLILLLDGTKKEYGDRTTNVFHLYSMLLSSSTQLTYYQPGIGSLEDASRLSKLTDAAFAFTLKKHLKAAYTFVIKNYDSSRKDKIYLFGYSRGAHTAHALAVMISKVGLVPKDNVEQVDKAYELYTRTDEEGIRLCRRFKKINGISPEIEFMGLWDTVSSVGLGSQRLPFTRNNLCCKKFRHALSLDERRAFFRPDTFQEAPEVSPVSETRSVETNGNRRRLSQMFLTNGDQDPDILEMWFAGGHSDVGGGSQSSDYPYSHSRISLRWMVRECVRSQLGLEFREEELRKLFLDSQAMEQHDMTSPEADPIPPNDFISAFEALDIARIKNRSSRRNSRIDTDSDDGNDVQIEGLPESPRNLEMQLAEAELRDSLMPIHDAMQKVFFWKLLGIRPRRPNDPILIHRSVRWRQDACKWVQEPNCDPRYKDIAKRLGVANYKPRARFSESRVKWDDQLAPVPSPRLISV